MRSLRYIFSLFLSGLILLLLGYALYMLSGGGSGLLQGEGAIGDKGVSPELVSALVGAFVSVVGLLVTSVLNWREDRRRERVLAMAMERQRLEIEKLQLQLAKLREETTGADQS